MSTTTVPPLRPARTDVDLTVVTNTIYDWLLSYQGDSDKGDDSNDIYYYDGNVDMATSVLGLLTEDDKNESVANVERRKELDRVYQIQFTPSSNHWKTIPEYNLMFLHAVEQHFTHRLRVEGTVVINDVLRDLGIRPNGFGAIHGWTAREGIEVDLGIDVNEVLQCIDRNTCESIQLNIRHHGVMYREIGNAP